MSRFLAALPMYDWPGQAELADAQWVLIRDRLRQAGIDAPERLIRCNGDMPAVPGGICNDRGDIIAPDPATLVPGELDLHTLWRHPDLLLAQSCWGPMEATDLAAHVTIIGQPDYSDVEGGKGPFYSSALLSRREDMTARPTRGLPIEVLKDMRLAFNSPESMSGLIALERDLRSAGQSLELFSEHIETGSHLASARAVAQGSADVCALDCRTWALLQRFDASIADRLSIAGWTTLRLGLPFITRQGSAMAVALRAAMVDLLVN